MGACSIKWCGKDSKTSNLNTDGLTFHRYPKDGDIKEKWIEATRRENWLPSEYSVICSRHFTQDCFLQMKNRRRLLSSAVPTLLLPLLADSEETECILATGLKIEVPKTSSSLAARTPECKKRKQLSDSLSSSFAPQFNYTPKSKKRKTVNPCKSTLKCTSIKKRLGRRIIELSDIIVQKNRQIKNLWQKTSYLKKRILSFKTIVKELQKSHLTMQKTQTNSLKLALPNQEAA